MRKFISCLLAAVMCLGTMAFAADVSNETVVTDEYPTTITLPNGEVQEVPVAEPAMAVSADASTAATSETVHKIYDEDDFKAITSSEWFSGSTFYIYDDLDLSSITVSEWYGVISFFYGNIIGVQKEDGTYPEISGIGNNRAFIYAIAGGTIENLTFKHDASAENGSASFITFLPTSYGGSTHKLVMNNITVTGDISLTGSDQSNYSPFVYCVSDGGITMTNCVNKASITGSIYGAVFYGYYPLYVASYTFENCVNYGDITMQYAGMFFGNSSTLDTKLNTEKFILTIKDCANYGKIRGTSGAKYIVAPVAGTGDYVDAVETALNTSGETTVSAAGTITVYGITTSSDTKTGSICVGNELDGFKAEISSSDSTSVIITRPTKEDNVSYYVIAVSAYVNLWNKTYKYFEGTDRYTVRQKIGKNDYTTTTIEPTLKIYGFADSDVGTYCDTILGYDYYDVYEYNGKKYYQISDNMAYSTLNSLYVSSDVDSDGNPTGGGVKDAQIVTVAAYDSDDVMLDCITITP